MAQETTMLVKYLGGSMHGVRMLEQGLEPAQVIAGERYLRWADHPATPGLPHTVGDHNETYVLEGMTPHQIIAAMAPVGVVVGRP
jgi:hypothetical protein